MVQIVDLARLFMLPCLLEIHALAWAIECYFALLAATLRTNASMHCQAKAFFLSFFADGAAHAKPPMAIIPCEIGPFLNGIENAVITVKKAILEGRSPKTGVFPVLFSYLLRK